MSSPDHLVTAFGVTVRLRQVTAAVYDNYDEYDEAASTIVESDIRAIISQPNNRRREVLDEGRVEQGDITITVLSSTDISADREGIPDRIRLAIGEEWHEVTKIHLDTHFFTGTEKKTISLRKIVAS